MYMVLRWCIDVCIDAVGVIYWGTSRNIQIRGRKRDLSIIKRTVFVTNHPNHSPNYTLPWDNPAPT